MAIILLTIASNQYKKKKSKPPHGYYMATSIDTMSIIASLLNNEKYYIDKYGDIFVVNFVKETTVNVLKCISQNMESFEDILEKEHIIKIYHAITNFIYDKLVNLIKYEKMEGINDAKKMDLIKYHFTDPKIIDEKYKKIKKIDKDKLMQYVNNKYGSVAQCAFVIGWLLGLGEEDKIPILESLGKSFGIILKISNDFGNLERDLENSEGLTYNLVVNYGIYECFSMFMDHKLKIFNECLELDIFNITIKEVIDNMERKIDSVLKKTDMELKSEWSSFNSNN
jgi:geranylgeranyl pyrophosphate synthase